MLHQLKEQPVIYQVCQKQEPVKLCQFKPLAIDFEPDRFWLLKLDDATKPKYSFEVDRGNEKRSPTW